MSRGRELHGAEERQQGECAARGQAGLRQGQGRTAAADDRRPDQAVPLPTGTLSYTLEHTLEH